MARKRTDTDIFDLSSKSPEIEAAAHRFISYAEFITKSTPKNVLQERSFVSFHADNCCEAHALALVLLRYDTECQNRDKFCLRNLATTYGKEIKRPQLIKHLTAVEEYFGLNNSYMSQMFGLMLDRVDERYMAVLFSVYSQLNSEKLEVATNRFYALNSVFYGSTHLSSMPSQDLVYLEALLLDCKQNESLLDPYVGYSPWLSRYSGGRLFGDSKAPADAETPILYLQDKDPLAAGMACANAVIFHANIGRITCENSLKTIFGNQMKFDNIIINRIFSSGAVESSVDDSVYGKEAFSVLTSAEMTPFAQAINNLSPNGRAIVLCSTSTLYKKSRKVREGRSFLYAMGCVEAVIELPPALLKYYGEAAALVILRAPMEDPGPSDDTYKIRMINAAAVYNSEIEASKKNEKTVSASEILPIISDLLHKDALSKKDKAHSACDVSPFDIEKNAFNLCPSRYLDPAGDKSDDTDETDSQALFSRCNDIMNRITDTHEKIQTITARLI